MLALEKRLQHHYPRWFRGYKARITTPLLRALARWSRFDTMDRFLSEHAHLGGLDFVAAALKKLALSYTVDAAAPDRIPRTGRLLIVANHPSGALDALALLDLVGSVRGDVKIVANDMLALLEPLSDLLLPVRILGGPPRLEHVRAIRHALESEACVIVFPAGQVSRLGPRGVRDCRWKSGFLRFARSTNTPILPVRIRARNSALFYGISMLYRPASTALLARELHAGRRRPLRLSFGELQRVPDDANPQTALRLIRRSLYASGKRPEIPTEAAKSRPDTMPDRAQLRRAIAQTRLLGCATDGKQIRLARLQADAPLLREIGRLRELTFRKVGEGTGRDLDLDRYDAYYEHILVWDDEPGCIAGAYRVARGADVLARFGLGGLYTAAFFRFADDAVPRLAAGMELGRSFVAPEYWGSRSLDYLWQGIGQYLQAHPGVRYLYGAVSISASIPREACDYLVAYYRHFYGGDTALACARQPYVPASAAPDFSGQDASGAFKLLRSRLAGLGASVPILYKQYTDLCEPGGARFLAFATDPDFNSVDGLIEIDLDCLRPAKRQRYLMQDGRVPA